MAEVYQGLRQREKQKAGHRSPDTGWISYTCFAVEFLPKSPLLVFDVQYAKRTEDFQAAYCEN